MKIRNIPEAVLDTEVNVITNFMWGTVKICAVIALLWAWAAVIYNYL